MSLQSRHYLDSPSFVERLDPPRRGVAGREREARRGPVKAERWPKGSGGAAQPLARSHSPSPVPPVPHLLLKRTGVATAAAAGSVSAMAATHVLPAALPGSEGTLPAPP